jgi:aryl-alcohol dehydrogenase-like predicted oxidoreductase
MDKANILEALDGSLRRLQTDYVDILHLHWPDRRECRSNQACCARCKSGRLASMCPDVMHYIRVFEFDSSTCQSASSNLSCLRIPMGQASHGLVL